MPAPTTRFPAGPDSSAGFPHPQTAARPRPLVHDGHVHHDPRLEHHHDGEVPIFDRGLAFDLQTALTTRRRMLGLLAGAALVPVIGASAPAAAGIALGACDDIPEETAGPFPADGSNGPNVLDDLGIVRRDLRRSFGGGTGVAKGVKISIRLQILDADAGCAPYKGAAVYIWQCDAVGRYSMYSQGVEDANYLRGVQRADKDGRLRFTSVFPGCYPGRWPHFHFEVFPDLRSATTYENKIATSQIALPRDVCEDVYASGGYGQSGQYLSSLSLETDMVFRDGWEQQLAKVKGDVDRGYTVKLAIAI